MYLKCLQDNKKLIYPGLFVIALLMFISIAQPLNAQVREDMTLFQFSRVVAETFDYVIIFSPRVRKNKKVGLVISDSLGPKQLYNVFLSVLDVQGYAAVKTDNIIRIVRAYKARSLPSSL